MLRYVNMKKVIIVGGGFGGVAAAKQLTKGPFEIIIIDRKNHHLFQPLLYQVATAELSPSQIAYPIRSMFRKKKHITVLVGHVDGIDHDKKHVSVMGSKQTFEYDYLIIAAGARHSYFGNDQWAKHAWGLKTIRDALMIRERMLYSFEKAERTRFEEKRRRFTTFVIVGAGPTGVEMAGAIAELTHTTLLNEFNRFDPTTSKIILVEGSDCVLNRYPKSLSLRAKADLESLGVDVRLNAMVTNVTEDGVQIGDEFIESENIIWAAGNMAAPLIKAATSHVNKMGQALVSPNFTTIDHDDIYCIGDCAHLEDANGVVVPAVAQGAMQAGNYIAKDIRARENHQPRPKPFAYFNKGAMATIGRSKAVARINNISFAGFPAWLLWGVIHVMFLIDFRNKLIVFMDWIFSYITHKRNVRLINIYKEKNEHKSL